MDKSRDSNHRNRYRGDQKPTHIPSVSHTSVVPYGYPRRVLVEALAGEPTFSQASSGMDGSVEAHYTLKDFPIKLDGTAAIILGKYEVALTYDAKCDGVFISVRWRNIQCPPICAMISPTSSEEMMRSAVAECADILKHFGHNIHDGDRHPISHSSVQYLANHHVLIMDKISEAFPLAVYWCYLCDYHMCNIEHVRKHLKDSKHVSAEQIIIERECLVAKVPRMSENQLKAINILINKTIEASVQDSRELVCERYLRLSSNIQELFYHTLFHEIGREGSIQVYGSVLTKTAIECSDLNLSIDIPSMDCSDSLECMRHLVELLTRASVDFATLEAFNIKLSTDWPMCINLTVSSICVRIAWRCESGLKFGHLLSVYTEIRPQFADLCRLVRKWAKISGIYSWNNKQGGLSSYGFDLMVLYFLQQIDLLPCLHEMRPLMSHEKKNDPTIDDLYENRDLFEKDIVKIIERFGKSDGIWNVGQLFVDFLRFYALRRHKNEVVQIFTKKLLSKDCTRWNKKLLQIFDPFRIDNVVTFTKAFQPYFFNCFFKSYLYFAIPQTKDGPLLAVMLYQKVKDYSWKTKLGRMEKASNSVLYKELDMTSLIRNVLTKDFNPENVEHDSICVYSRKTIRSVELNNPVKIGAEMYLKLQKLGIARVRNDRDNKVDCIKGIRRKELNHKFKQGHNHTEMIQEINTHQLDFPNPSNSELDRSMNDYSERAEIKSHVAAIHSVNLSVGIEEKCNGPQICYDDFFVKLEEFDEQSFRQKVDGIGVEQYKYTFENASNFNYGYMPNVVCAVCESGDHYWDTCPLMNLPTVEAITHRKEEYEWMELDHVIIGFHEKTRVKLEKINAIGECVEQMRTHLERRLKKHVRLSIFGSLINGFGVANSDVDLCFRFQEDEQPLDVDYIDIVKEIAQSLEGLREVEKVHAITGAKVPIVKFRWPKLALDGDISYYNVLAMHNTEMLKKYCQWDYRTAPLGVWVKRWAKSCDIGDASRGSLSSYAFILLLIHFLQNCEPPVLPRLQEDFRNDNTMSIMVENCDVYFHRDVVDGWSRNRKSVGELFTGFLDYYSCFDFETEVVQIRRKKSLLKVEKMWNRSMCIEDPFKLSHNLGSGVSKRMFVFIIRNFRNSRKHFMLSDVRNSFLIGKGVSTEKEMPYELCASYENVLLTVCQMGSAPFDRHCRICHRTGHLFESCPKYSTKRKAQRIESASDSYDSDKNRDTHGGNRIFGTQSNICVGRGVFFARSEEPH